jgi:PKD repeat protein
VFGAVGIYSVNLTATNAGGSSTESKPNLITVNPPAPVANFTATPASGTAPLTVTFTDSSTNTPTSWNWNFGDGTTSADRNPSHKYENAGIYTINLTATNAGGSNTKTEVGYITVNAPTVEINIENPVTGPVDNWNFASEMNTQNYGNLTITSNTNWKLTTSASNGDYLMHDSNRLSNKLQLNGNDVTTFSDSGSGNKTEVLSFSQQIAPSDFNGHYTTNVTFTWSVV